MEKSAARILSGLIGKRRQRLNRARPIEAPDDVGDVLTLNVREPFGVTDQNRRIVYELMSEREGKVVQNLRGVFAGRNFLKRPVKLLTADKVRAFTGCG